MSDGGRWTHERMLEAIASSDGQPNLPVERGDDEWEHNVRVLDDLFEDGFVRATAKIKEGAGSYVGLRGLRLTDAGRQRLRESSDTTVEVATAAQAAAIERLIRVVRQVEESELTGNHALVAEVERTVLETELRSPRPNRGVMRAAIHGLLWVASAAGSGVLGNAAYEALRHLT